MGLFGGASKLDRGLDAFARKDWKRARALLEDALEDDERAIGFHHLGLLYWRGLGGEREVSAAVECFRRAAEAGYPPGQTAYAMALRRGSGGKQDLPAARALFRSAAGAGDADAMIELATMSEPDEARYWLLRASELGHTPAMLNYSDLIMRNDPVEGLAWLYAAVSLAADEGARKRAAALAREMNAREIEAAQKAGKAYAQRIRDEMRGRA